VQRKEIAYQCGELRKTTIRNKFWQPKIEKLSPAQLRQLQERRLRSTFVYAYKNSRFYRKLFKEEKLDSGSIRTAKDIEKIPFTSKTHFRDNYPLGLLASNSIIRIHASSGTTGDPTIVAYSRNDIESWSDCIARCLTMSGITRQDRFQIILGYGLFTGGLGFHYGAEKIGTTVVPSGTGNTKRQVKLMRDLHVTAFTSIPSYSLYLAETAEGLGIEPSVDLEIKSISCGAEVWSQSIRKRIENKFGCQVFNSYGLSEMFGPGVAFECIKQDGMHVWSDHFIAEVIDPKTGETVDVEEEGELVLTTLTKEAMPVLRYRTGDLTKLLDGSCDCGRTHQRISWITGRCDDMIKVRGVNLFPTQIESAIMGLEGVGSNYQIVLSKKGVLDEITVDLEAEERVWNKGDRAVKDLTEKIRSEVLSVTGLKAAVNLLPEGFLPRTEGKVKRVRDSRNLDV